MKTKTIKSFREALIHSEEFEVHSGDRTRKIGKGIYAHYWDDGMIQRRDLYWFDGKTILLESMWQRYQSYEEWNMVQ